MVVDELVPKIDADFRTRADAASRASIGSGNASNTAMMIAFMRSDVFGRVGAQAPTMRAADLEQVGGIDDDDRKLVMYLEWGTYHLRSPHEAWDLAEESRGLWVSLREAGLRPSGGEVPEGYGWACWKAHIDELLTAMFPLGSTASGKTSAALGAPASGSASGD